MQGREEPEASGGIQTKYIQENRTRHERRQFGRVREDEKTESDRRPKEYPRERIGKMAVL